MGRALPILLLFRFSLIPLLIPDPRVQIGINEVDEEVVQQNDAGEKQVDPGDHRVIPV
jgi:hypothetical protein